MPAISIVVCVYKQRDLLERLLQRAVDCYDDLIVVHDGPDSFGVKEICDRFDGRWFEAPRIGSLEGQSPFAWSRSCHDWILRLDADEFPSDEMKQWLEQFRKHNEPPVGISGYTCIWPLWNGKQTVSTHWPAQRIFLFNRQRVRFFGIVEQVPIPDGHYQALDLVLHHQPKRRSYGLKNLLLRKQAYRWRRLIARSLLGKPTDLPCWRWEDDNWTPRWEEIRQRPFRTALSRLIIGSLRTVRDQWKIEGRIIPFAAVSGPVHHFLICLKYWQVARSKQTDAAAPE
jgi:hypothetical protein